MRMVHEDVLADETFVPPWRRRSNMMLLAACALIASIAAVPIVRDLSPTVAEEPRAAEKLGDVKAAWDVTIPEGLGTVVFSQIVPGHVLVTGTDGFAVLDAGTGERLWGEKFADERFYSGSEVSAATAPLVTSIVADAVVVEGHRDWDGGTAPTRARVLELHTGEERFEVGVTKDHDFRRVSTRGSLVVEDCDRSDDCSLSGYSWKNGDREWRHRYRSKAVLPDPTVPGVVEGQGEIQNFAPGAPMVAEKTFAVTGDYRPADSVRYSAIELGGGDEVRQWSVDDADIDDEDIEYMVMGPMLVERTGSVDTIINPASGEAEYKLRGSYAHAPLGDAESAQSIVDGKYLVDAYSPANSDYDEGFDEFSVVDVASGRVEFAEEPSPGLLLGGELGTVVILTGTGDEASGNPKLRGFDIGTGKQRWTTPVHPRGRDIEGFSALAVAAFDNHLAVSGLPTSWTVGDHFSGVRTHVVDLDNGRVRRVDDVQVQALGHNAMLGQINPPIHEDTDEPRLAYYQL